MEIVLVIKVIGKFSNLVVVSNSSFRSIRNFRGISFLEKECRNVVLVGLDWGFGWVIVRRDVWVSFSLRWVEGIEGGIGL